MRSKRLLPNVCDAGDEETHRLLDITLTFLEKYHGHTGEEAEALPVEFSKVVPSLEELVHHDLPYRVAAFIHFRCHMRGDWADFLDWFKLNCQGDSQDEAMEYYREHYFDRDVDRLARWLGPQRFPGLLRSQSRSSPPEGA